jgi:hypothetical protein
MQGRGELPNTKELVLGCECRRERRTSENGVGGVEGCLRSKGLAEQTPDTVGGSQHNPPDRRTDGGC